MGYQVKILAFAVTFGPTSFAGRAVTQQPPQAFVLLVVPVLNDEAYVYAQEAGVVRTVDLIAIGSGEPGEQLARAPSPENPTAQVVFDDRAGSKFMAKHLKSGDNAVMLSCAIDNRQMDGRENGRGHSGRPGISGAYRRSRSNNRFGGKCPRIPQNLNKNLFQLKKHLLDKAGPQGLPKTARLVDWHQPNTSRLLLPH